jgi:hypothetical protein
MAKAMFRIKPYAHPRLKFVVRSKLTGKWKRKFFATAREAKTYVEQQEIELLNHGRDGATSPRWLRVMAQRRAVAHRERVEHAERGRVVAAACSRPARFAHRRTFTL